ncbi:MAG: DEAD/DEAH box helicase family protein [Fibrobacter sp.]|uniref:DEAD/DEAH box helicase family protein n=2 Tax=Fibrobacter sp. TaxID=35828 RepID=UPI002A5EB380|nr:DEAD/DEAH box helicase family protein [Fibrobacter sp.]MDY5724008.1 DEAD/DEAH box helicase family protein [Fibrobacter sp.]
MAMQTPNIKTAKDVVPMIYAYTTPGITYHEGYTKIGYTEQKVEDRVYQQTHTAGVKAKIEWQGNAVFDDGSGETFDDHAFHAYLRKNDIKQPMDLGNEYFDKDDRNEWFYITPKDSRLMFNDFRLNRGIFELEPAIIPYTLRAEQEKAVSLTKAYKESHEKGEFLWNAKPRFGKTLAVYDFMKRIGAKTVLIVTNRPAIANSWYSDYAKFIGRESKYFFVSDVDGVKNKKNVISYDEFAKDKISREKKKLPVLGLIYFASLQDLKGSIYFGGKFNKLQEIKDTNWDLLVIDEAHEGVDTYKTDVAFDRIKRKFTLHLSGTPFKALANNKFNDDSIFNYTYADEQKSKRDWDNSNEIENPYAVLPTLNLYTYQMSEIVHDELSQKMELNGETVEYAFDLNEFFKVENGKFVHGSSVDKFLDALTTQKRFPFSTQELRNEIKHSFWLLDRVESARLLAKKLHEHPVFKDYEIVLAAGDGRVDDDDENEKSFDKVRKAIAENEKTITLSVGQLTTGVTIPEWTAVLMLSNVKSPSLYMQAAFRAQNPCLFRTGTKSKRKENAYVFDFDPARTLIIFEEFANDLSPNTSSGRGDVETRKKNIRELLNFFPVIGEDENGELIELDAEKVLSIPRKIKSVEVVRRGFMSNFLFQNINNVFSAPKEVLDIIEQFDPIGEQKPKQNVTLSEEVKKDLGLDENGEVNLDDEYVIGVAADIFGPKLYDVKGGVDEVIAEVQQSEKPNTLNDRLKDFVKNQIVKDVVQTAQDNYGPDMKPSDKRQVESKLNSEVDRIVDKTVKNYEIEQNVIEKERVEAMQNRHETGKTTKEIEKEFEKKQEEARAKFKAEINSVVDDFAKDSVKETVKTVETKIKERERDTIEDGIRDHLRGFSRTIPSFLMAYGDETVTLATFDNKIPGNVFLEVTSITLEQFRFLRDGGKYKDSETGEEKEFKGQLFDSVVFDDSVKEFLSLKKKLADYFDEKSIEDIFDYIPPQKTNQIFTPKDVVKRMVDMLEQENPGCFDDKDKTFIDLYMKSGLYITEIVKRLYQSKKMKEQFPNDKDRLRHIFEHQVYGLAPTEIIYKIATSFILGFADNTDELKHNFRQFDALPYAKEGTLKQKLDELFGK